jgi:pyruvate dehydrogenase E1 component
VVIAALHALAEAGTVPRTTVADAIRRYGIDADAPAPWTV